MAITRPDRPRPDRPRLLHIFSNFVASGPELRTVAVMNALGPRFRHLVVSMDGRTTALDHVNGGVDVRLLDVPRSRGVLGPARGLRELLLREAPDLLLTYNWGAFDGLLAASLAGLHRIIHHEDGFNADEAARLKLRRTWARRVMLRSATRVIVPSQTLDRIARSRWGIVPPRLRLIPNGVAASRLEPARPRDVVRASLGIPRGASVIGTVAHLRREKRLDRIIEILASLPAARRPHTIIVGEGPEREPLESAARERQVADWVHLVGAQRDVGDYLHALDIYLLTSDTEQMPVSLLEAMRCALPVVATRVGDVEHMLPVAQRAWTIPLCSEQEAIRMMTDACDELATDWRRREALGSLNRAHVDTHFSFDAMLRAYAEVYDEALSVPQPFWNAAVGRRFA